VARIRSTKPGEIVLCSVVKTELLYGAHKSARASDNLENLEKFFKPFHSLPFDDGAARIAGELRAALDRQGAPIGPNDLLIAAIALANGLKLITHNTDEFSRVPGLTLEDWEA
jgi:tRNA(fMet)-specific endonuclease VapC